MTLMMDAVDKDSSTTIIIILQMFSKLEERLSMLSGDVYDIKWKKTRFKKHAGWGLHNRRKGWWIHSNKNYPKTEQKKTKMKGRVLAQLDIDFFLLL